MNIKDVLDQTPLLFTAHDPDLERIETLVEAGADINATDRHGNSTAQSSPNLWWAWC